MGPQAASEKVLMKRKGNAGSHHVAAIARFALRLLTKIQEINEHSFNNFNLRIGMNVGPVVAGSVIEISPHTLLCDL